MLLSAPRSLLLLPSEAPAEAARTLALRRAAAQRLQVPAVSLNSANGRVGLATGRNQLVAACPRGDADLKALPAGTTVFLVIDCLPEAERPAESAWPAMAAIPVTAEMVVFEWLERGATDAFRDLIALIK